MVSFGSEIHWEPYYDFEIIPGLELLLDSIWLKRFPFEPYPALIAYAASSSRKQTSWHRSTHQRTRGTLLAAAIALESDGEGYFDLTGNNESKSAKTKRY
jgi:hypothetical protein